MVNKQKANVCRPWTPCFEIKEESIVTSEDKTKIKICEIIFFFSILKKKNVGRSVNQKIKKKSPK